MSLCEHIRSDAYECVQAAKWVFFPEDEPNVEIHACNDHLVRLLPLTQSAEVRYTGA